VQPVIEAEHHEAKRVLTAKRHVVGQSTLVTDFRTADMLSNSAEGRVEKPRQ